MPLLKKYSINLSQHTALVFVDYFFLTFLNVPKSGKRTSEMMAMFDSPATTF